MIDAVLSLIVLAAVIAFLWRVFPSGPPKKAGPPGMTEAEHARRLRMIDAIDRAERDPANAEEIHREFRQREFGE